MYTAVNSSVVSLNVQGITEQIKRKSVSSYLKDQRANVYFLQEKDQDFTKKQVKKDYIWPTWL